MAEKSPIWEHFVKVDKTSKTAECKYCHKNISCEHGNTSNLTRHVESRHKEEYTRLKEKLKDRMKRKSSATSQSSPSDQATDAKQVKIQGFLRDQSKWGSNDRRQKCGDKLLAKMICQDMQPSSIVEDTGFKNFVEFIQPSYQLPTRRHLRYNLIPELYNESVAKIKETLNNSESMGVTIDHWTSCANQAYMSVTAHTLTIDFEVNDMCLNVLPMPQRHTAENISVELMECIKSWMPNYQEQQIPIYVISDNASNVQAAMKRLPSQFNGLSCFAHTLQLCIEDSIKAFTGLVHVIEKAKRIVNHFHHSSQSTHQLAEMQKVMKHSEHKLKSYCPTRWNSTYYLIERLVEQQAPLTAVLSTIDTVTNLQNHEWKTAASYVKALKPFEDLTRMMSASRYSTISMVIPVLNILIEKMKGIEMDQFGEKVRASIKRRWSDYEGNKLYSVSSLLDPRFREFAFSSDAAKKKALGELLIEMVANYEQSKPGSSRSSKGKDSKEGSESADLQSSAATEVKSTDSSAASGECSGQKTGDIWNTFKQMVSAKTISDSSGEETETVIKSKMEYEIELYCREPLLTPSSSPFEWWNSHKCQFPTLANLARTYLAIPATSVASERIFSKAGLTISQRRSSLKPSNAETLICLSHNLSK